MADSTPWFEVLGDPSDLRQTGGNRAIALLLERALRPHPMAPVFHRQDKAAPWLWLTSLLLSALVFFAPVAAAFALAAADLPDQAPSTRVLDRAGVLSRAANADIEKALSALEADHLEASLITIDRLDYGLSLDELGQQVLQKWRQATPEQARLLLLLDTQTRAATIVADPSVERQLTPDLLRSTARTTMALPLRRGDRYRQATLDGLERLSTVLAGGDDPGEPVEETVTAPARTIPTQEETAQSNAFTWIVVLLAVGTIVPMLTWWIFSR
jgi:uncharacterized protein